MTIPLDTCKPITKLNSFKYPHSLLFFDTESYIQLDNEDTSNEKHKLRLGVAIYITLDNKINVIEREVYHYRTSVEFWDYIESKMKRDNLLYIYAHNAKYDTLNVDIVNSLPERGFTVPFPTINNAFIYKANKGKKKLVIVDTFNYVRTSVESLGLSLKLPKISLDEYRVKRKLSTNTNIKNDIDFNSIPDSVLFPYCENDVEIIEKWMVNFIKLLHDNRLGSLKYTTASTALDIYRHSFINTPIYYHRNDSILKLERESYRGGIVECFKLHTLPKQDYYLLDINSMYVSVMSNFKLPVYPILIVDNKPNIDDMIASMQNNYVIADVLLCVEENNGKYGLKHEGKLIFPIGEYRVQLHHAEIIEALKNKYVETVFSYVVYKAEYCLKQYADYFSELKKNATNKVDYDLAKLLGNGLYGKFGMRKYCTDILDLKLVMDEEKEELKQEHLSKAQKQKIDDMTLEKLDYLTTSKGVYLEWNKQFVRTYQVENIHVPRTNVALAGAVTAYARILLSGYIEKAGIDNIYYSDTDSLMVSEAGYNNLLDQIDDKELGKLKCEFIFNGGSIRAPKNYTFSHTKTLHSLNVLDKHHKKKISLKLNSNILLLEQKSIILKRRDRSKGIPTGAINENGQYIYWRFTSFKENLRSGGNKQGRIKLSRINSLDYTKGIDTGYITNPFKMEYVYNKDLKCFQNRITNQLTK